MPPGLRISAWACMCAFGGFSKKGDRCGQKSEHVKQNAIILAMLT